MIRVILLLTLLFISACDMNPRCIDASDFGKPSGMPAVNGEDVEPRFGPESDYNFFQKTWSSFTGYVLTGDDLIIRVKGAWSPWGVNLLNRDDNSCGRISKVCDFDEDFTQQIVDGYEGYEFSQNVTCDDGTSQPNICWFPYGIGVYVGFSNNPRIGLEVLRHLASPPYRTLEGDGWKFTIPAAQLEEIKTAIGVEKWESVRVYIRIHDNNYDDNIKGCIDEGEDGSAILNPTDGQITKCETPMELIFQSGARREEPGFLETAARIFMDPAKDIIRTSYEAYIESDTYQNIFYLCSLLFIVFTAIGYFTAFIQVSIHTLWQLIFRFTIVFALLSPDGWEFFNTYVVTLFWDGSAELASLVIDAFNSSVASVYQVTSSGTIDSSVLENVDDSVAMFVSYPLNSKIMALLFSHGLGWLMIVALYFSFYVFIFAMLKLTVIFIIIYVTIMVLLSIAPVFIIFSLFKFTRDNYFETWLKSLISVAIQPMMLFVFIGIFLSIISHFLYEMLYYKACWRDVFSLVFFDVEFWKVTDIFDYNDGNPIPSEDGLQIEFTDIFLLFVSAMIIRYITEQVPQVAERIGGGFSLAKISSGVMAMGKTLEYFGEEVVKTTSKSAWRRTGGRALSGMVEKAAPRVVSKYAHKWSGGLINKTKDAKMAKAQKMLRAELKSKGWKDDDIKKAMKSGKLKDKLNNYLATEKAKEMRYGTKSLNPLKIAGGVKNEIMDNIKMSMQKAQLRAQGKKLTKGMKKKLKEGMIKKELAKVKKGKGADEIKDKTNKMFDDKFANQDLRDSVAELRGEVDAGEKSISNDAELRTALADKMRDKGYDDNAINEAIDRDLGSSTKTDKDGNETTKYSSDSRIAAEFKDAVGKEGDAAGSGGKDPHRETQGGTSSIDTDDVDTGGESLDGEVVARDDSGDPDGVAGGVDDDTNIDDGDADLADSERALIDNGDDDEGETKALAITDGGGDQAGGDEEGGALAITDGDSGSGSVDDEGEGGSGSSGNASGRTGGDINDID